MSSFATKSALFAARPLAIALVSAALLSACASTPTPDKLFAGIDDAALKTPVSPTSARTATDPVCVKFYENTRAYLQKASKPSGVGQFFTQVGVGVLAGVATQGLASGIGSTAGRIAVGSAANSAVYAGSGVALRKLSENKAGDAKIIDMAKQIGCPVAVI
jgi:hypothetical protein